MKGNEYQKVGDEGGGALCKAGAHVGAFMS